MFRVGDMAVYPAHGVGRIEAIENKEIGGLAVSFYILKILENEMIIMVPVNNAKTVGLRPVIGAADLDKVDEILQAKTAFNENQNWNRRFREYTEKIKTGSIFQVAEVLRDLTLLKKVKELSFGERKLLDTASGLLIKELAVAKGMTETQIESMITSFLDS